MKKYLIILFFPIALSAMLRTSSIPLRNASIKKQLPISKIPIEKHLLVRSYKSKSNNSYEPCQCKRVVDCHNHLLRGLEQLKVVRAKMRLGYKPAVINQSLNEMNEIAGCPDNQALLNFIADDDAFLDSQNDSLERMIAACQPRQIELEEEQELADEYEEYTGVKDH